MEVNAKTKRQRYHEQYLRQKASLIAWVKEYGELSPGQHPTFVEAARKFRISHEKIEDLISDSEDELGMVCGIRCGGGIYSFRTMGEHQIEYCGRED